jgi:hypothetical protein
MAAGRLGVSAGLVPWAVVDSHEAEVWAQILPNIVLHREDRPRETGTRSSPSARRVAAALDRRRARRSGDREGGCARRHGEVHHGKAGGEDDRGASSRSPSRTSEAIEADAPFRVYHGDDVDTLERVVGISPEAIRLEAAGAAPTGVPFGELDTTRRDPGPEADFLERVAVDRSYWRVA